MNPLENLINRINKTSKADFVQRLLDTNRKTIPDWQNKNNIATHKMSYAENDNYDVVFPEVQNINNKLIDFSDPKNKYKKWDSYDSAVNRGDTIQVPKGTGRVFTENYKNYYPGFNKY